MSLTRTQQKALVEELAALSGESRARRVRELLEEHGALAWALQDRIYGPSPQAFFNLHDAPEDCPWKVTPRRSTPERVDALLKPFRKLLPGIAALVRERCQYVFAMRQRSRWYAIYLLQLGKRVELDVWVGGAPTDEPTLSARVKAQGWALPPPLQSLYAVHDGFGLYENIFGCDCVYPAAKLEPIRVAARPEEHGYSADQLLSFACDSVGNRKCLVREPGRGRVLGAADWDHETWELATPKPVLSVIDALLTRCMKEREEGM